MVIKVKNMICQRCKIVVENILSSLGLEAESITIGEIVLKRKVSEGKLKELDAALKAVDLELVYDKKNLIDQQIKNLIFEIIYYSDEPLSIKFSFFLSSKLNYNYNYLSKIFSEVNKRSGAASVAKASINLSANLSRYLQWSITVMSTLKLCPLQI